MWTGSIWPRMGFTCLLWTQKLGFVLHWLNVRQYIEWRRDGELQKIYPAALIYLAYSVLLLTVLHGISLRKEHLVINLKEFSINFDKVRWDMQRYGPLGKVKNRTRMWQVMKILHSMHIHGHPCCRMFTRSYSEPAEGLSAETVAIQIRFSRKCSKDFSAVA